MGAVFKPKDISANRKKVAKKSLQDINNNIGSEDPVEEKDNTTN
jgi:hypothetical protein